MKTINAFILTIAAVLGLGSQTINAQVSLEKKWVVNKGLNIPESVFYYPEKDVYFVSNIHGEPLKKDGNGYISIIEKNGKLRTQKWATGLDAPKGMGVFNNTLFVTDIDRLVLIDIETGEIKNAFPVAGASFLNDIAISPEGKVYISDSQSKKIYVFHNNQVNTWLELDDYTFPNGMRYIDGKIVNGVANQILFIDVKTKSIETLTTSAGGIDGLVKDKKGNFVISDWQGLITYVDLGAGNTELWNVKEEPINTADMEYYAPENLLLVPTFQDNKVIAYEIKY